MLDAGGQPLANALVLFSVRPANQRTSSGGDFAFEGAEEVRTGPDGRYTTPAQLPVGHDYRVSARAPGYEPAGSNWLVAPSGVVPDLALRRSVGTREVAGRVVDSAGKPVVGAEVYQTSDGPKTRTRGTTEDDGRFRVAGVPDAPAFLFVAKEGYRFVGRRVDPGDKSVEFALRRFDEPAVAPLRRADLPVSRDDERAVARALIAEARKAPGGSNDVPEWHEIPEITALVDPDRVVEMIENQVVLGWPHMLTAVAVGRFEADPRTAFEIIDAISNPNAACATMLGLFDRLGATAPPEFRRELLERAGRRAREIGNPGQAADELARVADRWLDLGETDRGAKLVREALVQAEKPREPTVPDPRNNLIRALARVDLPAALKLLEDWIPPKHRRDTGGAGTGVVEVGAGQVPVDYALDTIRAGIAERIAATDPSEARRILGMIGDLRQQSPRRVACLRMAATDLPAARALAAEGHDPKLEALLPAAAAKVRAGSDPDGARVLLRESVERIGKLDDGTTDWPSPAVALARLLPLAVRIDPDRAADYLWLALSRRSLLSDLPEPGHVTPDVRQHYLELAELAALTARFDRAAAEAVFAPVAARLPGIDDERDGLGNMGPQTFRAAGAFDARVAKTLLDALPEDPAAPVGRPATGPTAATTARPKPGSSWPRSSPCPPGSASTSRSTPFTAITGSKISTTEPWAHRGPLPSSSCERTARLEG